MKINVEKIEEIAIGQEWDINTYNGYETGFYSVNGMLYYFKKETSFILFICMDHEIPAMETNTDNTITQDLLLNVLSIALHKTKI